MPVAYNLKFIQRKRLRDGSDHISTYIYKFKSDVTGYFYIVNAERYTGDVFALKFYCKKDRKSIYKYNKVINKGDVKNILFTCAGVLPIILSNYNAASFFLACSGRYDPRSESIEPHQANKRFKVYHLLADEWIGEKTFQHFIYEQISCHLWVNRNNADVDVKEREIVAMLRRTYIDFPYYGL